MPSPRPRRAARLRRAGGRGLLAGVTSCAAAALLSAGCTADGEDAADPGSATGGDAVEVVGSLRWSPCEADELSGVQCSTLAVPLDPDEPEGPTIELALSRKAAQDPDRRIGSLLVNPGGPGASGVELVGQLAAAAGDPVLDRFDLVGFDPRGVGRSAPVRCIDDPEAVGSLDGDPDDPAEVAALVAAQADARRRCEERHADLLPHLSTADAAADLDRIREATGDAKLTYLGFSYGTQLGATYATMFPDRIRALVLDGAVAPDLSPAEMSETQALGFERAFDEFTAACRDDERCAVRPDARAAYEAVRAEVEAAAIPISTDGDDRVLAIGDFQIGVVGAMYDPALWPYLADGLQEAQAGDGATLLALADIYRERRPDGTFPNTSDANTAINCADSTQRGTVADAEAAAERLARVAPTFGAQLGWMELACIGWPEAAEPTPEVATTTTAPILVIGTVNDPATPYEWAGRLTAALGGTARLLTYEGDGHTAYPRTACVSEAVEAFLVELALPADGTRCPVEDGGGEDGPFAGIAPELRDGFVQSGASEEEAACIARTVAAEISATDLVAIYHGEPPPGLTRAVTAAATECAEGG